MADEALAALTGHPDFGKRVFWLTALDDQALLALYRHAYASVLPSHYEGYGLPVVEALSQGCVTVASDAGSLPEIAAGHAVSSAAATAKHSPRSSTSSMATPTIMLA